MLISKRPIKLAVAAVSLAAIAAMSAPPAVAASTPHDTAISPQDRAILTEQQMPGSPLGLPSEAAGPVQTNYWSAVRYSASHQAPLPAGANNFRCQPKAGQHPVVLIPGTATNAYSSWSKMSEELTRRGYCTYTFNLNGVPHTSAVSLTGDMRVSAKGLQAFVHMVLERTHTTKVDLVGWFQGAGPLPNQYLKFGDGAKKVDHFVGLVPSNHGTTAYGLNLFLNSTTSRLGVHFDNDMEKLNGLSAPQQLQGSAFNKALYDTPVTQPGVKYTVITSTHDHVVVPYTNAYLHEPGVKNVLLQDVCPTDQTGHGNITYDPNIPQLVDNELDPAHAHTVHCTPMPFIG